MIIEALLNVIYGLFNSILSTLNIPAFPDEARESIVRYLYMLDNGSNLVGFVIPIDISIYFTIFFSLFAFEHLYPVIMWILRKIPMLGIE